MIKFIFIFISFISFGQTTIIIDRKSESTSFDDHIIIFDSINKQAFKTISHTDDPTAEIYYITPDDIHVFQLIIWYEEKKKPTLIQLR